MSLSACCFHSQVWRCLGPLQRCRKQLPVVGLGQAPRSEVSLAYVDPDGGVAQSYRRNDPYCPGLELGAGCQASDVLDEVPAKIGCVELRLMSARTEANIWNLDAIHCHL